MSMIPRRAPIDFITEQARRRRWFLRIGAVTYRVTRTFGVRLIIYARHWL